MRIAVAVLAAAGLAGCVTNQGPAATTQTRLERLNPVTISKVDRAAIEKSVRASLKDPTSAMFGDMRAGADSKGVVTVCGLVNAKNSYGGYTGSKPFMGVLVKGPSGAGFVVAGMGGTDIDTMAVTQTCREQDLSI